MKTKFIVSMIIILTLIVCSKTKKINIDNYPKEETPEPAPPASSMKTQTLLNDSLQKIVFSKKKDYLLEGTKKIILEYQNQKPPSIGIYSAKEDSNFIELQNYYLQFKCKKANIIYLDTLNITFNEELENSLKKPSMNEGVLFCLKGLMCKSLIVYRRSESTHASDENELVLINEKEKKIFRIILSYFYGREGYST
jgi:hypothetical protein